MNVQHLPSGLLIAAADNPKPQEKPKPPATSDERFRRVVVDALQSLESDLDDFAQTTHMHIMAGGGFESTIDDLAKAWESPSAFHISNLAQSIRALVSQVAKHGGNVTAAIEAVAPSKTPNPEAASDRLPKAASDLLAACRAGARYSDALSRLQGEGLAGAVVESDELDRLFMEWHNLTHAALANVEGRS